MENYIRITSEAIVLIFNVLIYMQLTVLKKDGILTRFIIYAGSTVIISAFFAVTCTGVLPESTASFMCVTLPSFLLFFVLSKYKDYRFFVTFCFLDTVTLIFIFCARTANILWGNAAGIISAAVVAVLMVMIYIKGKPVFRSYRNLIVNVKDDWQSMAISTLLIYLLLVFAAAYPKPLIERVEYAPVYMFISVTVLSFYAVFLTTLNQKKKLADLNAQLLSEKEWHRIAYYDALTGMKNRMAYIEKINDLERTTENTDAVQAVMIDIDNFKKINDTLGHHVGDLTLQSAAEMIETVFAEENYSKFRIGGDEFAVVAKNIAEDVLRGKINELKSLGLSSDISCSFSIGYSATDFRQKNAMENAFIRADSAMYEDKLKSKKVE